MKSDLKPISMNDALSVGNVVQHSLGDELTVIDDISIRNFGTMPTQIGFLLIALCTEGEASFSLCGKKQYVKRGDLLISLGEQIFSEGKLSEDFHGKAVLMSSAFAQNCISGLSSMWPYLLYVMENPVLTLSEREEAWIWECYNLICSRLSDEPGRFSREAIGSLVRAFYFEICNLLDKRVKPVSSVAQDRSYAIFDKFIRLVSDNFKRERSVEWYSSEMCLTPKYLTEVVKQVSGRPAGQWITTYVMTEIKMLLKYTSLSVKEVAQEMNFSNQSFFGKYFKNVEGISPSDFRKAVSD